MTPFKTQNTKSLSEKLFQYFYEMCSQLFGIFLKLHRKFVQTQNPIFTE